MKKFLFSVLILAAAQGSLSAETYTADPALAELKWYASKVTGKHDGSVKLASGAIEMDGNALKGGEAVIDMTSITVDDIKDPGSNAKLAGHLKSADFFDTENHPTASLKLTEVKPGAEAGTYDVTADLTIKGITKPANFTAKVVEIPEGVQASASITVDRTDYDVRYGSGKFFENLGDRAIHDDFRLEVFVPAVKSAAAAETTQV